MIAAGRGCDEEIREWQGVDLRAGGSGVMRPLPLGQQVMRTTGLRAGARVWKRAHR
ncbi:MAG: hypothetical protein C5S49_03880 [Candidatus Methanogaster sp.]|nr:MAG: hypothetical protein C5S49_03880 [ANME-2 cluster archaeon]